MKAIIMETITIVDTAICSDNVGDEIIMDSVNEVIRALFPDSYIYRVPSHESLSGRTRDFVRRSSWCFIGGTNILSSDIQPWGLWRLDRSGANALGSTRTICLGTGWRDYMSPPTPESRTLLTTALSSEQIHAARDRYTQDHLVGLGLRADFTACPTTWALTKSHCDSIPTVRAKNAVVTVTGWLPQRELDTIWLNIVRKNYEKVYFFSQMQEDYEYLISLGFNDFQSAGATLASYDDFLKDNYVDFIGTRLHGGIRALQKGRRALILSIDNRATEMGKDTGLPVVARSNAAEISNWIATCPALDVDLPHEAISRWKAQFSPEARASAKPVMAIPETRSKPIFTKRVKAAAKTLLGRG